MRQVYAHHATLVPGAADAAAPGAAVTAALNGHAAALVTGDPRRLRILFATEPHRVDEVRDRIDTALATGDWQLIDSGCARVEKDERPHARRLLRDN